MAIGSAIAIYFVVWWMTLFVVLPFGVRSQTEAGQVVSGTDPGAPVATKVKRIVLINTAVSLVVCALFWMFYVENMLGLQIIDELNRR
jgi:predicted secreted protein